MIDRLELQLVPTFAEFGGRQGIPYITLMENNINHPNVYGHTLFADSLMALFPKAE